MANLTALHTELIDHISTYLDVPDIASLRLTCRTMGRKATSSKFTALFKQKNIQLSTQALQRLVQVTSQGSLGCLLEDCSITGIAQLPQASLSQTDQTTELVQLLTTAFRNLKQHSPNGKITSIRLLVVAREQDAIGNLVEPAVFRSWGAIWAAASHTFKVVMAALSNSGLYVECLDIFNSINGCSLVIDDFMSDLKTKQLWPLLKTLSVSLSAKPVVDKWLIDEAMEHQYQPAGPEEIWTADQTLRAIANTISHMPFLQSLNVHWYIIGKPETPPTEVSSNLFNDTTMQSFKWTGIQECSLHGIQATPTHLLQFLQTFRPQTLTLTDVSLVGGTYSPIFEYLSSAESSVTSYHLDDLDETRHLVHFNHVKGTPKFRYRTGDFGPSTVSRCGLSVKEPISYQLAHSRVLGSGERARWLKSKAERYGRRPGYARYNFISLNSTESVVSTNVDQEQGT
ncbi:hypothetical protein VFPPC_07518 [Pochonia chlamydosporia 170]|uniref:F-box domain-containing protein n=1 Tax=Pochonia chlamydosporia 170 TaxID=1380566 RepID=A0A179FK20_METCM|nr:hypothetical protein VFPPC_07518 [Pochonia chlamydosporia 170]OAQ65884.1 hypothetical protein VFPPC_07518 [Pochonia chlamydosporia 170]